jgi:hypothetical protein
MHLSRRLIHLLDFLRGLWTNNDVYRFFMEIERHNKEQMARDFRQNSPHCMASKKIKVNSRIAPHSLPGTVVKVVNS